MSGCARFVSETAIQKLRANYPNLGKFRITITMKKPIVHEDYWTHKPTKNQILELLGEQIHMGEYDDFLVVEIKPVEVNVDAT